MASRHRAGTPGYAAVLRADLVRGIQHHQAGRLDAAEALYRKILRRSSNQPDALHFLGVVMLDRGRFAEAIRLIERSLAVAQGNAAAHANLGNALRAAGRIAEAADHYRAALAREPRFALAHNNLGVLLNEIGKHAAALESFMRAIELEPKMAEAYAGKASALRALSRLAEAEVAFRRSLSLRPAQSGVWCDLGSVLGELERFDEAIECHRKAIAMASDVPAHHAALGQTEYRAGNVASAIGRLRHAVELAPNVASYWNDLGRTLRVQGQFEEATMCFGRALSIDPGLADAHRNLMLIGEHRDTTDINRLGTLLARPDITPMDRVTAGFALGKLLDDMERFDDAFVAYATANRQFRDLRAVAGERFDAEQFGREVDEIITRPPDGLPASGSELPVFIVGMPRSGTSLVEQIAASHAQVFGAGELRDIGRIAAADRGAMVRLADEHVIRLSRLGAGALRVIDKMPDNIFHLGLIASLYPNARIVFCTRDPRDTALSCFFQLFPAGLLFSYDLADCAARLTQTERLAGHWRRTLPLPMLEVSYEALVADLEGQSRRLIEFLGLNWDPACLAFHQTERPVKTASGWQVRQPIYRRSIGRWRHYGRHLGALEAALAAGLTVS